MADILPFPVPPLSMDAVAAKALETFRDRIAATRWFSALGEIVNSQDRGLAPSYLQALGFPDCSVHYIHSWEEAETACEGITSESPWWMEENRLFEEVMQKAVAQLGEEPVTGALQQIAADMAMQVPAQLTDLAREGGYFEDELIMAAFGMAVRTTQMVGAMLLSGTFDPEHPFTHLFGLYECGHWPVGLVGRSFVVF